MPVRRTSAVMLAVGWTASAVPILFMGVGGLVGYLLKPEMISGGTGELGYPKRMVPLILSLEVGSTLLYAIPPTAVLGAVLMTGFLGGAVASHLRLEQATKWPPAVVMGVLVWLGLYLRDARVRSLLPIRRLAD